MQKPSLLRRYYAEVSCRGELVLLQLGNLTFSIEFPVALQIAAAMRHEARMAKLFAGVKERGFYCVGVISDLNAPKPKRKRFMENLPELLRARNVTVRQEGQLVLLKFGRAEARIPFETARMIAQWLRVRGKEAKRNAGEKAHWSRIDAVPAAINCAMAC